MRDVSVVIPARNAAATLPETLRSVLIAPEVGEVIVVDDGSTDDTAKAARQFNDPRIRVIPGPESGIAAALNEAFSSVTLPFVARCDADDLYPQDRLRWQREWLVAHPDFIAVSGGFTTTFPDGSHASKLACGGDAREVTDDLLNGESVTSLCSWLTRTSAILAVGGARAWFKCGEDIDLQFRLAEVGRVWHVPETAYTYRLHDASITHRTSSAVLGFFEDHATLFAKERRAHGKDRLQLGKPPTPPAPDGTLRSKNSAVTHATGQVIGAAWREFEANTEGEAYRRLNAALMRRPFSGTLWRHALILNVKRLKRSIF